jgi:transposase InsO family protein
MLASKLPVKAWDMISMDFCGPYPESVHGNKYVLVIVDQFTKYVILTPCAQANARTAYRALYEKIICSYGCPEKLLSDNGRHFKNSIIAAVCAAFRIFQTHSSPYYPEGD